MSTPTKQIYNMANPFPPPLYSKTNIHTKTQFTGTTDPETSINPVATDLAHTLRSLAAKSSQLHKRLTSVKLRVSSITNLTIPTKHFITLTRELRILSTALFRLHDCLILARQNYTRALERDLIHYTDVLQLYLTDIDNDIEILTGTPNLNYNHTSPNGLTHPTLSFLHPYRHPRLLAHLTLIRLHICLTRLALLDTIFANVNHSAMTLYSITPRSYRESTTIIRAGIEIYQDAVAAFLKFDDTLITDCEPPWPRPMSLTMVRATWIKKGCIPQSTDDGSEGGSDNQREIIELDELLDPLIALNQTSINTRVGVQWSNSIDRASMGAEVRNDESLEPENNSNSGEGSGKKKEKKEEEEEKKKKKKKKKQSWTSGVVWRCMVWCGGRKR